MAYGNRVCVMLIIIIIIIIIINIYRLLVLLRHKAGSRMTQVHKNKTYTFNARRQHSKQIT